ncbi:YHYH protein [Bremerella alba]|uniref:YHYH domain-containing protein n=1 Tax=Bremerella alba TaxID=980252 RepID=A0A7V8V8C9_9BACT|nr:YHYH protein [Bremerella alba]MBA2116531.1 hypothetical protein [Bremerella alba]
MTRKYHLVIIMLLATILGAGPMLAQLAPRMRQHLVNQARALRLIPANSQPPGDNQVSIEVVGDQRIIRANGIPDHQTGSFPNRGNPNGITQQQYVFKLPANPKPADRITPLPMQDFGIGVNGVPFDPGAAEWYQGNPRGGWQYEALSGAVPLGMDANHAHVQPTGAYHYHGLPSDLLKSLNVQRGKHSPIIGWAADGFPIYALYGFQDANNPESEIVELETSYRLKEGKRPSADNQPGGKYDGTFIQDYEFVEGLGDLDECNGRFAVTPDYPDGTYAYYLTNHWPVIPRNFRGTPSEDFRRGPRNRPPGGRPPGGPGRPGFGPPPRR